MLSYSYVDPNEPIGIPARMVNGGLYGGEPFKQGAGWGNIPQVPEAHLMVAGLNSVHPGAAQMIPGYTRPGNNTQTFPDHQPIPNQQFMCVKK